MVTGRLGMSARPWRAGLLRIGGDVVSCGKGHRDLTAVGAHDRHALRGRRPVAFGAGQAKAGVAPSRLSGERRRQRRRGCPVAPPTPSGLSGGAANAVVAVR